MNRPQEISQSFKSVGSPKPDTNASPHWVACTAGRKAAAGTDVEDLYNRVSVGTRALYLGNTNIASTAPISHLSLRWEADAAGRHEMTGWPVIISFGGCQSNHQYG